MSSIYKKCIESYRQLLFVALLILCHVYRVSYAYALIGYIGNSIVVNTGLKHMFRSTIGDIGKRPVPYHSTNTFDVHATYGFPSGHAQAVGYFMAFCYQFLPWRTWHLSWIVASLAVAIWLMHTRITSLRHTAVQVIFGFAFGVATFFAFHLVWKHHWSAIPG